MNTYTKLKDGSWGIRSSEAIKAGDTVAVTKKSGEEKIEKVGKVVWAGNGVTLATIATSHRPNRTGCYGSYATIGQRMQDRMDRTGWTGCSCGSIEGRPRDSDCASCRHDY